MVGRRFSVRVNIIGDTHIGAQTFKKPRTHPAAKNFSEQFKREAPFVKKIIGAHPQNQMALVGLFLAKNYGGFGLRFARFFLVFFYSGHDSSEIPLNLLSQLLTVKSAGNDYSRRSGQIMFRAVLNKMGVRYIAYKFFLAANRPARRLVAVEQFGKKYL